MTRPILYKKRNLWQKACWLLDCSSWELLIILFAMVYQLYLVGTLVQMRMR